MRIAVLALITGLVGGPAAAAPVSPSLQATLLDVFERYGSALQAGRLDDALALRDAATRSEAANEIKSATQRREFLAQSNMMRPDAIQVVHTSLTKSGAGARLLTVATKTVPKTARTSPGGPAPGSIVRMGLTLRFVNEAGQWKFAEQTFGADPSVKLACPDERNEPASAYDESRQVSMGGPISRVSFAADHTLVVIRVVDEADCAFLPPRAQLVRDGVDPDSLVPYAILSLEGIAHHTDKQKILATHVEVAAEDP